MLFFFSNTIIGFVLLLAQITFCAGLVSSTFSSRVHGNNRISKVSHASAPIAPLVKHSKINAVVVAGSIVVLEFEPAFSPTKGDTVEYQAFFSSVEPMDSVVSVNQSSCCMDQQGACQSWRGHSKMTCHGIKIGVDYKANVMVRSRNTKGYATHSVYRPVTIAGAKVTNTMTATVTMQSKQYKNLVKQSVTNIVASEVREIHQHPHQISTISRGNMLMHKKQRVALKTQFDEASAFKSTKVKTSMHHQCILFGLCALIAVGIVSLLLFLGWKLFECLHAYLVARSPTSEGQASLILSEPKPEYQPLILSGSD